LLHDYKIFAGSPSNKNVLRILPALNIKKPEAVIFLKALSSVLEKRLSKM
jgi:acetylornithine aminotransferase